MLHADTFLNRSRRIPWPMVMLVVGFCVAGVLMMVSAGSGDWSEYASSQMLRFFLGFACMLAVMLCPPLWLYRYAYVGYAALLLLLLAVDIIGHVGMGAQRWLRLGGLNLQPSEFMKIALVLALARFYHNVHPEEVSRFKTLIIAAVIIGLPVLLILRQPNLGTATVLSIIGVVMLFFAGVSWKYFAAGVATLLAMAPVGWNFLHDYQKQRVMTFLSPDTDPLGAGYNIIQSQIAIGSGGMWGKGYLNGSQAQLNFLPEKHTDFIFTMLAEEWGFVGSVVILLCYAVIFLYGLYTLTMSRTVFARIIAAGITAFLFAHVLINIAMVMGLLPVVGLPLPFLSYGGSITITSLIAMGLLLNMGMNKEQPLLFKI